MPKDAASIVGMAKAIVASTIFLVAGLAACSQSTPSPSPSPNVISAGPMFEVLNWGWDDLDESVSGVIIVENQGDASGIPICTIYYSTYGFFTASKPVTPLAAGESRELKGTFHFPIPVFNYENDGEEPVRCYASMDQIPAAEREAFTFEERVCEREHVVIPEVSGLHLFEVGGPLYRRCLEVRLSPSLQRLGPRGQSLSILRNLILKKGPRVETRPSGGTVVAPGSVVEVLPSRP